jgi:hypothetical protein
VRYAHNRSQRLLRGFTVAVLTCGPVLALAAPAHGDDPVPGDTTTTTVATTDPTTDTTPDSTVPVTTPDTTVPVTTPSTDPPVDTTDPPATDPPATDPTSDTTTATTAPSNNETPVPVVATPGDPSGGPGSGSGSATTGGSKSTKSPTDTKHDAAPVRKLLSLLPQEPFNATAGDAGTMRAGFASISIPVGDVADLVRLPKKLSAQLQAFDPSSTSGSWTDIGAAAPRFGPWIVLLAMAYVVRLVIASILADRTRGPRRRRWTLL